MPPLTSPTDPVARVLPAGRLALLAAIVFLAAFSHGLLRINREFIGDYEGTACGFVMMPPINYLRYGPFAQRLGGLINVGEVPVESFKAYVHHPPGVTIASAVAHALFGRADWVARLAPTLFTSLTITLLAIGIAAGGRGIRAALLAAGLFIALPINAIYGGMPDYISFQAAFFSSLAVYLWVRSVDAIRPAPWRWGTIVAFLLACGTDWVGFYAAPAIFLGALAIQRRFDRFAHVVVPAVAAVTLIAFACWMTWAGSDVSLVEGVLRRSAGGDPDISTQFTIADWLQRVPNTIAMLHSPVVALCVPIFVAVLFARAFRGGSAAGVTRADRFAGLLVLVALIHFTFARQGCYQHEWWLTVMTPGIVAAAALTADSLINLSARAKVPVAASTAAAAIGIVVIGFAAARLDAERRASYADAGGYTLKELGLTIRRASAPTEGVLTSDSSDWLAGYVQGAGAWYADRQLRPCIIDVARLDAALAAGDYPLFMLQVQKGGPAPRWFVLAQAHRASRAELAAALDARFPRRSDGKFDVYDLTRSK